MSSGPVASERRNGRRHRYILLLFLRVSPAPRIDSPPRFSTIFVVTPAGRRLVMTDLGRLVLVDGVRPDEQLPEAFIPQRGFPPLLLFARLSDLPVLHLAQEMAQTIDPRQLAGQRLRRLVDGGLEPVVVLAGGPRDDELVVDADLLLQLGRRGRNKTSRRWNRFKESSFNNSRTNAATPTTKC